MTKMPSYVVENPNFEPFKHKTQYNLYSSLLPILLSIFTYILIFYVLDVSPSSIFNDTKILFFISNALIIIIAADYGAFTDKENHDFYGEYTTAMRRDTSENPRLENSGFEMSLAEEIKNREKQEEEVGAEEEEVPEKTIRVMSENQQRNIAIEKYKPTTEKSIHITARKEDSCDARKLLNPKPYGRSKSDSSKWMVVHKGKKSDDDAEEKWENVREESEEFSNMSNEELNKRVEDFIQRFNRDIKRQSFVYRLN